MDVATLTAFVIVGLSVGFIARLLVPGPDPMGWIGTIVLGIVGSFVGGFLGSLLFTGRAVLEPSGWVGSIIGAVIVLLIRRRLARPRTI